MRLSHKEHGEEYTCTGALKMLLVYKWLLVLLLLPFLVWGNISGAEQERKYNPQQAQIPEEVEVLQRYLT